jgi:hypothetical protein
MRVAVVKSPSIETIQIFSVEVNVIPNMQQVNQHLVRWLANTIHKETTMPQGHVMPQISIDNQAYDLDTLSIEAKAQR